MDPISVSLALSAAVRLFKSDPVQAALGHLGDSVLESGVLPDALRNAYQGLKDLIGTKAPNDRLVRSIEKAEQSGPDESDRLQIMTEKLDNHPVASDKDVLAAAERLLALVKAQPGGAEIVATVTQNVTGNNNTVIGVIRGDYK